MSTAVPTAHTELGLERLCRGCDEFWPVDDEFWYFDRKGNVLGRCKACWAERNRDRDQGFRFPPMKVAS